MLITMDLQQGQKLCNHFGLGTLRALHQAGGTRNTNYRVETETGRWFLRRRYSGYCEEARLRFDHEAARYLAERGVPVPQPRMSRDGGTWLRLAEAVWEVFPYVEGTHLRDGNAEDVEALGTALAQWHQAGRDFPLRYEKAAPRGETDPTRLLARADEIEREVPATSAVLSGYRRILIEAARVLPDAAYAALPHTLIHGDIQPANLLLRPGWVAAFVDIDWCAWQARVYDLCFAVLTCCAAHATPFDGGDIVSVTQTPYLDDVEVVRRFLQAYESHTEPLTPAERQSLRPLLRLCWCHIRLDGSRKVPQDDYPAFLERPPDLSAGDWPAEF
jgi:homoserine kinase type II